MYDFQSIYCASSVEDAIDALTKDEKAVIISGGSDVLIKIREGRLIDCTLISIHDIASLKGVTLKEDGTIVIGAGTAFSQITSDPVIQKHLWMLGEAVDQVGGPQVRNIGTIGGNVCNGVTSADSASTLLCMNAVLKLVSKNDTRYVPIREFYTGPGKTVRNHSELLTEIHIAKKDYEGFAGKYIKYGKRNAMEIATLGCAAYVKLAKESIDERLEDTYGKARDQGIEDRSGKATDQRISESGQSVIKELRLGFGVAAPTPIRCPKAEHLAAGKRLTNELLEQIAECALTEVNPRTSWRASKEFRLSLIYELTKRAVAEAVERAGGKFSEQLQSMTGSNSSEQLQPMTGGEADA